MSHVLSFLSGMSPCLGHIPDGMSAAHGVGAEVQVLLPCFAWQHDPAPEPTKFLQWPRRRTWRSCAGPRWDVLSV